MISLKALSVDVTSGSSEILALAVNALHKELSSSAAPGQILTDLDALCKSHPTMGVLKHLQRALHEACTIERLDSWVSSYREHETSACRHFASHLEQFNRILVHSNSGLLRKSFQMMKRRIQIFCTESRPSREGIILAEELAGAGHTVTLLTDMAAFSVFDRIDALAFGCDGLTKTGIVNKIGTSPLALNGKTKSKNSYFVATTEKWVDEWDDSFLLRQGSWDQIYAGVVEIRVESFLFDFTPAELVSGLFLEDGLAKDRFL